MQGLAKPKEKPVPCSNRKPACISPKRYNVTYQSQNLLYHLRAAKTTGTFVFRWLLFLYPKVHMVYRR